MPIYEYQCDACGHTLETLQKISEPALTTCPACGAEALKKLISASAFRLKGGGWYETDFKRKNQRNVVKADSEAKPKAGAEGKSESGTRPEGKAATASKATAATEKKAD
jgi:putative FmdB family regulatory protein